MTEAPVPLAEQIAVISRVMMRPRGAPSPHRDFYEEARDERESTVLIAAIATLQQHERAMAALRLVISQAGIPDPGDACRAIIKTAQAALDDAASAAGDAVITEER